MNHRHPALTKIFLINLLGSGLTSWMPAGPETKPAPRPPAPASAAVVWQPGVTKGYYVRRYVDPANPRVLHGGHVVWRREDDGGWILAPQPERVESGPSAGLRRTRQRQAPLTAELAAEVARQRAATAEVRAGAARIRESQEALAREAADVARLARELQARLPGQSESENRARAALQAELKRLGERLERLEKAAPPQAIAPPTEPARPSPATPAR